MMHLRMDLVKAFALVLLHSSTCSKFAIAFRQFELSAGEEWESLDTFRRLRGIDFDYTTTALHPEFCRHLNQSACEELDAHARRLQRRIAPIGQQKGIVILLKVTDNFATLPREDYDLLFNDRGVDEEITPTGSVYKYFADNSYNQFLLDDIYVHSWTDAQGTEASCAGTNGENGRWPGYVECWIPALDELDQKHNNAGDPFDWGDYDQNGDGYIDNLIVIFNGFDAAEDDPAGTPREQRILGHAGLVVDGIWQSAFTGIRPGFYATASGFRGESAICRINIICHEFIHTFGMIDLYDLDFATNGCGGYDIMAYPFGQRNRPREPGNVGPYTKIVLGWLNPIEITQDGTYMANPSFTSQEVYKVSAGYPEGEYLLIENRQQLGWDTAFWGGGGIVIWSIDESALQNDATQTRVKIIQADGRDDLEKRVNFGDADDLWVTGVELADAGYPNTRSRRNGESTDIRIYDFSPSQPQMEFTINLLSTPPPTGSMDTPAPMDTPVPVETSDPMGTPAPVETPAPMDTPVPVETSDPMGTPPPAETSDPMGTPPPAETSDPMGTPAPGDQDSCALVLNTEDCLPLLAATTPEPDCGCYNYCGNEYLGCCEFGAACPVICNGGGTIVAGCSFPPPTELPSESPSGLPSLPPTALPTTLAPSSMPSTPPTAFPTTLPPTLFPTTLPPTVAPVTDAPVTDPPTIDFSGKCRLTVNIDTCATLVPGQPEVDGCDCYNYCEGEYLNCCAFGEECPPVSCGSSNFAAGCELLEPSSEPSPVPTPIPRECSVQVSTDQCSDLMQTVTPRPECDCYNFCNGVEIDCCLFEIGCSIACTGDFVGGCLEETPTPPPQPEPEQMCLTSINTDLCSLFTPGQTPDEECDCYNYCNGNFEGCCAYGEFCGFSCQGLAVAGCELEPQCLVSINTNNCGPLVETQEPIEDCECYNYCNGQFQGCCGLDEFCGINCPGTDAEDIAAGCILDATPAPVPDTQPSNWPVFFWPEGFTAPKKDYGNDYEF